MYSLTSSTLHSLRCSPSADQSRGIELGFKAYNPEPRKAHYEFFTRPEVSNLAYRHYASCCAASARLQARNVNRAVRHDCPHMVKALPLCCDQMRYCLVIASSWTIHESPRSFRSHMKYRSNPVELRLSHYLQFDIFSLCCSSVGMWLSCVV